MKRNPNRRLREWRIYIKVVELGNITSAAKSMNIEVSTASKALSVLEEELNISLIERTTRTLKVTTAGIEAYEFMKSTISSIDSFIEKVTGKGFAAGEKLKVSAPAIFCDLLLVDWIKSFQEKSENSSCYLHAIDAYPLGGFENDFDISIHLGDITEKSISYQRMDDVRLINCASKNYIERHGPILHPNDLYKHEVFNMFDSFTLNKIELLHDEDSVVFIPNPGRFCTNSFLSKFNLILKGSGVGLAMPGWLASGYLKNGDLVHILPDWKIPSIPIFLTWKKRKFQSKSFNELVSFLDQSWRNRETVK